MSKAESLQPNRFRELRERAGYAISQIANAVGVSWQSAAQWDRGGRPRLKHMRLLASIFGVNVLENFKVIWCEAVGDPCPCGCGGEKVLPANDEATQLDIETPCENCSHPRLYTKSAGHKRLCARCEHNRRLSLRQSPFRKLRVEAGYRTVTALACKVKVAPTMIYPWDGDRSAPPWPHPLALAKLFHVTVEELIAKLWGQNVGDRCKCGLGTYVLPTRRRATRLDVEIVCPDCKTPRIHIGSHCFSHREICPLCVGRRRHQRNAKVFVCVGYPDHLATRWAPRCLGKPPIGVRLLPNDIRTRRKIFEQRNSRQINLAAGIFSKAFMKEPLRSRLLKAARSLKVARPFIDEKTCTLRCKNCSAASREIAKIEFALKQRMPNEPIQSRGNRNQLLRNDFGHELFPDIYEEQMESEIEYDKKQHQRGRIGGRVGGLLATHWSREPLPNTHLGYCRWCKLLTMSGGRPGVLFHSKCREEWLRTPQGRQYLSLCMLKQKTRKEKAKIPTLLPTLGPGQWASPEALKTYYSWAIRHHFGDQSLRYIASTAKTKTDHKFVLTKIKSVLEKLPDTKLINHRFRPQISILKGVDDLLK